MELEVIRLLITDTKYLEFHLVEMDFEHCNLSWREGIAHVF